MTYLKVLVTFLLFLLTLSVQPTPNCSQGFFYQTLPITPSELVRYDLDDLFTGYNIDFTLTDASDYNFVNITKKLTTNAQQTLVDQLIGLKSVHMEQAGNEWGQGFIALTQKGNDTVIQYGVLTNNKSAPVVNYRVVVQKQHDTRCFDAILFAAKDLVLVDCMIVRSKVGEDGKLFQNRFIYVKLSEGKVIPHHVDNQLYVNYTSITRRRLNLYTDHQTGHHFMLRAYFADGVDIANRHNTYIDVFSITDPLQPWSLRVIDRSIIHKSQFAITDFKMYLGDIYVLDYWQGLFRVDITNHMQIIVLGHYAAEGYTRFGVFSEDMDDTFVVALANTHYIIEIDWSDRSKPILLTKYTILPNSTIEQVMLNLDYLVLHSLTPVNKTDGTHVIYNYTWIFNRKDRTFNKAFKVINHNTYKTAVFLNKAKSYLMVVDEDSLTNYAIERPILSIKANSSQQIQNQKLNFTVVATSNDPLGNVRAVCKLVVNFTIVSQNNKTIWPTGRVPPAVFSVNSPGDLYIPIHDYVLGANVTYDFKAFGENPPKSYVLQQDQMGVHWTNSPGLIASRFLHADLWKQRNGNDTVVIYVQDYSNKMYVSFCETRPLDLEIYCNNSFSKVEEGGIKDWGSGTYFNTHTQQLHHAIAYTLNTSNNTVIIHDITDHPQQIKLQYPSGYAGYVSAMQITNNYLVVCQQYIKTITVYNLQHCNSQRCHPIYEINSTTMKKLGIHYFSPINVETSIFHDEVLFIQTEHSVIVLDVDKQHHPILLGVIESDATRDTESQFRMEFNSQYLFISNYPHTIEEYDISDLYKFKITHIKNYPLYGYTLPENYDLDVSDQGDTVYVSVLAPDGETRQIFVYRGGFPTVATLYDTIQIDANKDILIDVTGFQVDYVIAIVGSTIRIYKQLEQPLAIATGVEKDTDFALEFHNDKSVDTNLSIVSVKVQNWPVKIVIYDYYKDIMNTKDLLTSGENVTCEFDDEQWHTGHVVNITAVCPDCGDKVIVKGHVHEERQVLGIPGMHDYQWGYDGGSVQQESHIIHMLHNGSIDEIVNLPQAVFGERCLRIGVPVIGSYQVSACESTRGVQVYITSFISNKGFSWGPWSTSATRVNRVEVIQQLVMLVDTDRERSINPRQGGIHLFAINMRPDSTQLLEEIDIIDSDDFGGVAGWDSSETAYLSNAELTWTYQINTYRLLITEQTKGMFVVDFKWRIGSPELTIKNIDFIDLPKLLETNGYHMPYDARFEAITVLHSQYDHEHKYQNQSILVTTGRFHTFQIGLSTDDSGIVINLVLQRVYLRYAGFHVQNYIRHHNEYFLISQIVPQSELQKRPDISRQIISVYHTEGKFNGTVENRSMRSAYVMKDRQLHLFDFNWTFMGRDTDRVGLALVDRQSKTIRQLSVYKNITVTTKEELPAQIIRLNFSNDYSYDVVRIYLKGTTSYPRWKLVIIIVAGIVGALMLAAVGFVLFVKIRAKRGEYYEERQSLMTDTN